MISKHFPGIAWPLCAVLMMIAMTSICGCSSSRHHLTSTSVAVPALNSEIPSSPYKSIDFDYPLSALYNPKIYVYKTDRKLLLVENDVLIREYKVGLGFRPAGDKYYRGDGRTPEGQFYVCTKNPSSKFYKSLGLSYPSPKHAEEAFQFGFISRDQYQCIVDANEKKQQPPWNTDLGGAIMIHGGGGLADWTEGCVAISDYAMDELFKIACIGMPVEILP